MVGSPVTSDMRGLRSTREPDDVGRVPVRRRSLLAAAGSATSLAIGGCLGSGSDAGGDAPAAVTIPAGATCDVCGMTIRQHPGPTTQIFYAEQRPSGHDNPARFDSTWEAFQYDFQRRDRGWTRTAFYVTDYSSVDYEIFTEAGTTFVSTHPVAEAFTPASDVTFVVGSSVQGAMGRDLIAFSDDEDATEFAAEHGGSEAAFDDVTRSTIAELAQS